MPLLSQATNALSPISNTLNTIRGTANFTIGAVDGLVGTYASLIEQAMLITQSMAWKTAGGSHSGQLGVHNTSNEVIQIFDKDLYDKSIHLAKLNNVGLVYSTNTSKYNYGLFTGGNTYIDYNGTLDSKSTSKSSCYGWITLDRSSNDFVLFSNTDVEFIISLNDFSPQPIVLDFTPLHDKIVSNSRYNQWFNDLNSSMAIVTSCRYSVKDMLLDTLYLAWLLQMAAAYSLTSVELLVNYFSNLNINTPSLIKDFTSQNVSNLQNINTPSFSTDIRSYYDITNRVGKKLDNEFEFTPTPALHLENPEPNNNDENKKDEPYPNGTYTFNQNIQAIIYAVAYNYDETKINKSSINDAKSGDILVCYQTPETVAYTASATYDSPSPRGTQDPFHFYTSANAVTLSFTLNFHVTEFSGKTQKILNRTKGKDEKGNDVYKNTLEDTVIEKINGTPISFKDIPTIATNLTRPWKHENSIQPKLVHVILPGISKYGYLQDASITHSGDISGERQKTSESDQTKPVTDLQYSQIEISFTLLVVEDNIELHEYTSKGDKTAQNESTQTEQNYTPGTTNTTEENKSTVGYKDLISNTYNAMDSNKDNTQETQSTQTASIVKEDPAKTPSQDAYTNFSQQSLIYK